MINKFSVKLTDVFFAKQNINEEERELYTYGFFMFLSHLMYLILASFFGVLFGVFVESIIFYVLFQFIRRNAGGYHATTETRCEILSTLLIFSSIALIKFLALYNFGNVLICMTLVSAIIIFLICPLDTLEKPLSRKEFTFFKKKTRIGLIAMFLIAVISYSLNGNSLFFPCCISIIAESVLIIAGKIKKVKTNIENEES